MSVSFRRESSGYGLIAMQDGIDITSDSQLDNLVSELNSNSTVQELDDRLGDPDDEDEDDLPDLDDEDENEDEDEEPEGY